MVTHKTIAKALGVHVSTVSLSLKGDPRISEKRRKSVVQKAEELGYVPDPRLQALCAYRNRATSKNISQKTKGVIALILQNKKITEVPFHRDWIEKLQERASVYGYKIDLFSAEEGADSLRRIITSRGIHGIVLGPYLPSDFVAQFDWRNFTIIKIGHSKGSEIFHQIIIDEFHISKLAFQKAVEKKYQRIGFCITERMIEWSKGLFRAGYLDACLEYQSKVRLLEVSDWNPKSFRSWIQKEKIDCLISDAELYPQILKSNCAVPRDFAFIGVGVTDKKHEISGIPINRPLLGETAADWIVSRINLFEIGIPAHTLSLSIPSTFHEGNTLPLNSLVRIKL